MDLDLGRILDYLPGMVLSATLGGRIDLLNEQWSDYAGYGVVPNQVSELFGRDLYKCWRLVVASGLSQETERVGCAWTGSGAGPTSDTGPFGTIMAAWRSRTTDPA
jgi:hypothetical protein